MWTTKNRPRYDRDSLRYPSDLTDEEWSWVEPWIPPAKRGGRRREVNVREVLNGVMYVLSTGCQWRYIPRDLPPRASMLFSLLLSPAAAVNVLLDQNAFLTGALLIGGMGLPPRFPLVAGVLLGLPSYKPQLCPMVPVVLLSGRHWRTAMAAGGTAVLLALVSAAVFGAGPWLTWIESIAGGGPLFRDWVVEARLNGMSVYACAVFLGGSPIVANIAQAAAALLAAGLCFALTVVRCGTNCASPFCWRRRSWPHPMRLTTTRSRGVSPRPCFWRWHPRRGSGVGTLRWWPRSGCACCSIRPRCSRRDCSRPYW